MERNDPANGGITGLPDPLLNECKPLPDLENRDAVSPAVGRSGACRVRET